jgi:hypothetical protein
MLSTYLAKLKPPKNRRERESFWRSVGFCLGTHGGILQAEYADSNIKFGFVSRRPNDFLYGSGQVTYLEGADVGEVVRRNGNDYEMLAWFGSLSDSLARKVIAKIQVEQSASFERHIALIDLKRIRALLYGKSYQDLRDRRASTISASKLSLVKAIFQTHDQELIDQGLSAEEVRKAKNLAELILIDVNSRRTVYKSFVLVRQFPGNPGSKR